MLLGVRPGEDGERQVSRLERALEPLGAEAVALEPLFAPMLGVDIEDNETSGMIPAQARKEVLHGLMTGLLGSLSARQPLLVVIEDAQWLDSLSPSWSMPWPGRRVRCSSCWWWWSGPTVSRGSRIPGSGRDAVPEASSAPPR